MSRISGLRNDVNKKTFYKERKINNRCFDFLSKQNIIVPLILNINEKQYRHFTPSIVFEILVSAKIPCGSKLIHLIKKHLV